jgi:hypothetical protein
LFHNRQAAKYHRGDLAVIATVRPKLGMIEDSQGVLAGRRWNRTDKIPYGTRWATLPASCLPNIAMGEGA